MSSSSRSRKEKQKKVIKITGISTAVLAVGCYLLFVVSRSFKPLLGNTFHILAGCILIAISSLVLAVTLKNHFFPKKKRKRSNVVFLEDELRKSKAAAEAKDQEPKP